MKNSCLSKLISVLLLIAVVFGCCAVYAEGGIISSDSAHKYLKIGLSFGTGAVDSAKLESTSGFLQVNSSFDGWNSVRDLTAYKTLYARYSEDEGCVVISDADGTVSIPLPEGQAVIAAATSLDAQFVNINGKKYRDGACFSLNENRTINVLNYIEVEHYLWGVIKNEIGNQYPAEAIKAFAVTARSFAYANRGMHSKYGFDLCTGNDCQMYRGVSAESASCTSACKATENLVMKYNGKIATGNHFANSGGHTLSSEDAWVSAVPYLRGVEDPYSPELTWDVTYTYAQVKEKLRAQGINIGDVLDAKISSATDYGAVLEMTLTGTNGTATLSKGKIKSAFSLKSQLFTLEKSNETETESENEQAEEPVPGYIYVIGKDGEPVRVEGTSVFILGKDDSSKEADADTLVITDGEKTVTGAQPASVPEPAEKKTETVDAVPSDTLTFHGRGSGHGVGMSQSGTNVMAQQGFNFEQILKFYYTGITVEKR